LQRAQQIRINELLLQREELFLRIHAAETESARILGEPYPFTRPALPSDRRSKRKSGAAPAIPPPQPEFVPPPPPGAPASILRRLDENETAYRVTYRQFGQTHVETHQDHAALATLLACQSARLEVIALETLDAAGSVGARLFS
jgi:hypothetical protein